MNIAVTQLFSNPSIYKYFPIYKYFNRPKKKYGIFKPKKHAFLTIHEYNTDCHYTSLEIEPPRLLCMGNKIKMDMWLVADLLDMPTYERTKHIGYLAGIASEKYRFCHSAGLILDNKGILLIGQSGNGKSTLTTILEGDILHDDFLLVSKDSMQRVGKRGAIRKDKQYTYAECIDDDNYYSKLDLVFLLNNQYDPDYIKRIKASDIPAEMMFDNQLHTDLFDAYKRRMPINFEVPVFEIGTKREPTETKKVIEDLVSDVKIY